VSARSPILLGRRIRIRLPILVAQVPVFLLQPLALLLHGLQIAILALELLLQAADLADAAGLRQLRGVLPAGALVALVLLDLLLEAQELQDVDVRAVEDQAEEEREAAEVHVALGVELAGLDFHALGAEGGRSTAWIGLISTCG
jgi:hypothetical protein